MFSHQYIFFLLAAAAVDLTSATLTNYNTGQMLPNSDDKAPVLLGDVEVTQGQAASLACDMSLPSYDDAIYLVLWFMEPHQKPIYTFDARGKPLSMGRSWSDLAAFGLRANFRFTVHGLLPRTGHLVINNITVEDEGVYRCRVDFKNSPARHNRAKLNVIVPPSEPKIGDEMGRPINSFKISPLDAGKLVVMRCSVIGGRPAPKVVWYLNNEPIPSTTVAPSFSANSVGQSSTPKLHSTASSAAFNKNVHVEKIELGPLSRFHQDARLTCRASNSLKENPVSKTIMLEITLPPIKTKILPSEMEFIAGEMTDIRCQTFGSRPAAYITWWKDNERLPDSSNMILEGDNVTTSVLRTTFSMQDHDKILTCRAVNRQLDASAIEDFLRLNIQFAPVVSLRPGSNLNVDLIKEGEDVYFECSIHSNPKILRLIWKHENQSLVYNASNGIIMSNQSLVLRGLTRNHSGNYKCIGVNSHGTGISNSLQLTVRFSPVCQQPIRNIRGAGRSQSLTLSCPVQSLPSPLKFRWALNTTQGWRDIASTGLVQSEDFTKTTSNTDSVTLRIQPEMEADFGTVACWAFNDVGWQQDPCLFRFFPAGPPESLSNCSLLNQSADSLHVSCHSNDDGGLDQTFQLQVMDVSLQQPLVTLQSNRPEFFLSNLEAGSTFMLYLYAMNTKGSSHPVVLPVSTLKEAAKRTVPPTTDNFAGSMVIAVVMGTGVAISLIVIITVVACIRYKRRNTGLINESTRAPTKSNTSDVAAFSADTVKITQVNDNKANGVHRHESLDDSDSGFYHHPVRNGLLSSMTAADRSSCILRISSEYLANISDVPESSV